MSDSSLSRRAEWAPQSEVMLGWPDLKGVYQKHPEILAKATQEVTIIAQAIAHFQPVSLYVDAERYEEAEGTLADIETPFKISLKKVEGDGMDLWLRDFGPTFVIQDKDGDKRIVGLDYNYNGLGGSNPTPATCEFAKKVLGERSMERIETSIVAEGGALQVDGDGTLLATKSSILNDNRNPGKSEQEIEDELVRTLGLEKIIWIPGRPGIDVTDCHIDALARFLRPGVVVLSKANQVKPTDWTMVYEEALEILSSTIDAKGRPLEILEIEEPDQELFEPGGFGNNPPVRSYVNFLMVPGGIILPQFGDPAHDSAALRTIQGVVGDERRIYPVLIEQLPRLGGGVHCATQEIPLLP
ncbi:hypothetical protein CDD82_4374 [Ophiocordyceps australis]|uniref:Agmatine deiminase n=1 Tax=Ophiocordyceps australis TaxID=1399860 RepID=A0A2C5Z7A4_9HYPO|nr:hypothetical protein CDD82_4374 [Ophiocordyceps australis]